MMIIIFCVGIIEILEIILMIREAILLKKNGDGKHCLMFAVYFAAMALTFILIAILVAHYLQACAIANLEESIRMLE